MINNIIEKWQISERKFANKKAIEYKQSEITYTGLELLSNRIVNSLLRYKKQKNEVFGFYGKKDIYYVATILAIWKMGCAFIPLDKELPHKRVEYILKNAKINTLLTNNKYGFENLGKVNVINIFDQLTNNNVLNSNFSHCSENDLSYIIYTSGSTGKPKGVEITVKNLTNFIKGIVKEINLDETDCFLSITSISFDISILELIVPLLLGATIVLNTPRMQVDMSLLRHTITKKEITCMQGTPVTWRMLVNSGWKNDTHIKILCGGEKIDTYLAHKLYSFSKEFYCLYGPTEATIWTSVKKVNNPDSISLGTPLNNIKYYVLDNELSISKKGELYIEGDSVAKGYRNNKLLTKERFINLPKISKKILYKTGDIVERNENQEIYFIGRKDGQIKRNGYRIELEEIEKATKGIDHSINECISYFDSDSNGIFLLVKANKKLSSNDIIKKLNSVLPSYMIPTKIYQVDKFELTYNFKIDRKKTFEKIINKKHEKKTLVELQNVNKNIWKKVSGKDNINIYEPYDNYSIDSLEITEICLKLAEKGYFLKYTEFVKLRNIYSISRFLCNKYQHMQSSWNIDNDSFVLSDLQEKMLLSFFFDSRDKFIETYKVTLLNNKEKNVLNLKHTIENTIRQIPIFNVYFELNKRGRSRGRYTNKDNVVIKVINTTHLNERDKERQIRNYRKINNINSEAIKILIDVNIKYISIYFIFHHIRLDMFSFYEVLLRLLRNIDNLHMNNNCITQRKSYFIQDNNTAITRINLKDSCQKSKNTIGSFILWNLLSQIFFQKNKKFSLVHINREANQPKIGNNISIDNYDVPLTISNTEYLKNQYKFCKNTTDYNLLIIINYLDNISYELDKCFINEPLKISYSGQTGFKNTVYINIIKDSVTLRYTGTSKKIKQIITNFKI